MKKHETTIVILLI